ncbi:MAG: sensor histidine kinase protein, partial [Cryobacterium sp.]|nr:sensor histidine kinase protein [Cryobacterium sp.]
MVPTTERLDLSAALTTGRGSLSSRFLVTSAIVTTVGMALLGTWVSQLVERSIVAHATATIAVYVEALLEPHRDSFTKQAVLNDADRVRLDQLWGSRRGAENIRDLKIWARDGTIIYSMNISQAGVQHPIADDLASAFRGAVVANFNSTHLYDMAPSLPRGGPLLEVYIPLREPLSEQVIAVAEIYESVASISDDVRRAQVGSALVVAVIGLVMVTTLYALIKPASTLIERQGRELAERVDQLSSSLSETENLRRSVVDANRALAEIHERLLREVSADLHDGPAQLITLALLRLDEVVDRPQRPEEEGSGSRNNVASAQEGLREALGEIRALASGFALPDLAGLTLVEALQVAARGHERRTGTGVALDLSARVPDLPATMISALYRFVQE